LRIMEKVREATCCECSRTDWRGRRGRKSRRSRRSSFPLFQVVVVDCRAHMLGRLASVMAKELLSGQHVVRHPPGRRWRALSAKP
jgi:hypothetical protein